jgi:Na+-driven multidrug efflux pump
VGFALLLPRFFGLNGVLYSMPVSDILTAVVSAIIIAITYKQLDTGKEMATQQKEAMVNG